MICTKRDQLLIETLARLGILSTSQIKRSVFGNVASTTVRRRLRLLEKKNVLFRVSGLEDGSYGWCLTKSTAAKIGLQYPNRHINKNTLRHDILLADVRLALESVGLGKSWTTEGEMRARAWRHDRTKKEKELIPDGLFSATSKNESKAIAVELEVSTKSKQRYEKILDAYRTKKSLWSVWYIVASDTLGRTLQRVWRQVNKGIRNDLFIWSSIDSLLENPWDVKINSEYFSFHLRDLISMQQPIKSPALVGALPKTPPLIQTPQPKTIEAA